MDDDELKETSMLEPEEDEMEDDEPDMLDMGITGKAKGSKKPTGDKPHDVMSGDDEDIDALAEEEEDEDVFDDVDLI